MSEYQPRHASSTDRPDLSKERKRRSGSLHVCSEELSAESEQVREEPFLETINWIDIDEKESLP